MTSLTPRLDEVHPAPSRNLRGLFLTMGAATAALAPFTAVILHERGLTTSAIGVATAAAAVGSAVLVPSWGHLADSGAGRAFAFRVGLSLATVAALASLLPVPVILVAAALTVFTAFLGVFHGLGDALAIAALSSAERQYGALRALSSLSFASGVIATGFIYNRTGYWLAPVLWLVLAGALFLVVGRVRTPRSDVSRSNGQRNAAPRWTDRLGSVSAAFQVQPRLWAALAVLTLVFAGLQGAITFVGIRIVELGGQPSDVALSFGIASFSEIPGLVVGSWAGRRLGLRSLFVWAAVVSGVCIACWGVLPSVIAINATRFITGFSFGSLAMARVVMVSRLLPSSLQATGQMLVQATGLGLGALIGNVLGGFQYGLMGPTAFFVTAGTLAIVGGLLASVVFRDPGAPVRDQSSGRQSARANHILVRPIAAVAAVLLRRRGRR